MVTQIPKKGQKKLPNQTIESLKDFGTDSFDQMFNYESPYWSPRKEKTQPPTSRREFSIFNYQEHYERETVKRQIKELTELIKREVEFIKKSGSVLINEVANIEKLTIDSLPEKPGIYHIRFLEIVLRILQTLRLKIGESKTWMQALITKKKKRGSLFLALSKKKGTQYSLSQELQSARSVQ